MNRVQMVSGEVFRVIPGSLYPALRRLEAGGLIKAEWGDLEAVLRRSRTDSARRLIPYELSKGA